jgi:CRISPR-associated protein Cas4
MISATTLSTYSYCARKLWLQQVLDMKEPLKDVVVLGTVTHLTFNAINKQEEELVASIPLKATHSEILDTYTKRFASLLRWAVASSKNNLKNVKVPLMTAFSHAWPMIRREAEYRSRNVFENLQHHCVAGPELWEKLSPKIKSEYRITADDIGLKGIVDQLEVYPTFIRPIELKTGKAPAEGVWPGHKLQVAAYALMLESVLKTPVSEAVVHYLEANVQRIVPINPFLKDEVLTLRDEVNQLLASTVPPPKTPDLNKCASCGLRERCHDEGFVQMKAKSLNTSQRIAIPQ